MSSRIEQIIEEIEGFVESCKYQPLSSTKIVVNKEELQELLRELKLKTPDEIKRYQKIISNKDQILADAQKKADITIENAKARAQALVEESEIMQRAYMQANETIDAANREAQSILDSATRDANDFRLSAITYTDELMENVGLILSSTLSDAGAKYKGFIDALQQTLDVVNENRKQLAPQTAQAAANRSVRPTKDYDEDDLFAEDDDDKLDDLDFDEPGNYDLDEDDDVDEDDDDEFDDLDDEE